MPAPILGPLHAGAVSSVEAGVQLVLLAEGGVGKMDGFLSLAEWAPK